MHIIHIIKNNHSLVCRNSFVLILHRPSYAENNNGGTRVRLTGRRQLSLTLD